MVMVLYEWKEVKISGDVENISVRGFTVETEGRLTTLSFGE